MIPFNTEMLIWFEQRYKTHHQSVRCRKKTGRNSVKRHTISETARSIPIRKFSNRWNHAAFRSEKSLSEQFSVLSSLHPTGEQKSLRTSVVPARFPRGLSCCNGYMLVVSGEKPLSMNPASACYNGNTTRRSAIRTVVSAFSGMAKEQHPFSENR